MGLATNLWPADIANTAMRTPVAILREQASFLTQSTNGLVTGEVKTAVFHAHELMHTLFVVAPGLDNYRFELLRVKHKQIFYPLEASSQTEQLPWQHTLKSEGEFIDWLREVLNSDETKRLIHSLLAQVTDVTQVPS